MASSRPLRKPTLRLTPPRVDQRPRKLFAQAGARSSGDRFPGGGRRPGRVPSASERRSHPASLLEGHSDVGARDALKRRLRLFDTISQLRIPHAFLFPPSGVNELSCPAGWPPSVAPRPATARTGHRPSACGAEAAVLVVLMIHSMMLVGRTVRRPPISVNEPAQQPSTALWRLARLPTAQPMPSAGSDDWCCSCGVHR